MPLSSFADTVWRPGQPLNPTDKVLGNEELSQRLLYLEKVYSDMQLGDLPMSDIQRALEQNWIPDPQTLFAAGSVSREALAVAWAGGKVASAGTKVSVVAGSPDWTVVRNGAGDYTVTFPAYKATPLVFATGVTQGFARATATTTTTARLLFGGDTDFDWMVWGK
jgi:hypothetical protein